MRTSIKVAFCAVLIALASVSGVLAGDKCCASSGSSAAGPVADNILTPEDKESGWHLLFDGKSLDGWVVTHPERKGWVVSDGTIFNSLEGHNQIYTKERFGNFELKIDFKVDRRANSGIFFRCGDLNNVLNTGIEMQVLDSASHNPPGRHSCGAIYDILAPSENAMKPALEWNSVLLRCKDSYISVKMNGKQIIYLDLDKWTEPHKNPDGTRNKFNFAYKDMPREGHVWLQDHGGKVWYKNIKIRELE